MSSSQTISHVRLPYLAEDQQDRQAGAPPRLEMRVTQLDDIRNPGLPEAWDENPESWSEVGVKVIKCRTYASLGFDTNYKITRHHELVGRALKQALGLSCSPVCMEMTIIYGPVNPGAMDIDTAQVGPVHVTTLREIPSSRIKIDPTPTVAEYLLRRHYGDEAFNCFERTNDGWEIVEWVPFHSWLQESFLISILFSVHHPQVVEINKFPFVVCDRRSVNTNDLATERSATVSPPAEAAYLKFNSEQRWSFVTRQKPFELLVRRVASKDQSFDAGVKATVPLVTPNVAGDGIAIPEDTVSMRYPFGLCDLRTMDPAEDIVVERLESGPGVLERKYLKFSSQQCWFFVSRQKPFELLVRRIPSKDQELDPLLRDVPMAAPKASDDQNLLPESAMRMQFVRWWPQEL
ncbi:hypothetical protein ACJ41O_009454 [Fusarium nematophilum]